MVPHRALLSLSILCLTAPRGLAVGDPVKVAASIGQARSSPLFGFGNEFLFQTSTDGGLNGELRAVRVCFGLVAVAVGTHLSFPWGLFVLHSR
jgi:hypothetical protein